MSDGDRGRLRRLVTAVGALAGVSALAGCQTLGGSSDGEQGADGDGGGGGGGGGGTDDEKGGSDGDDTDGDGSASTGDDDSGDTSDGDDPTPTVDCDARRSQLRSDLDGIEGELETQRAELERAEISLAEWRAKRAELPGGHPEERVAAARALGERVRESVVSLQIGFGSATGWFVEDGLVLTNAHNLYDAGVDESKGSVTGYALDGSELDFEVVGIVESNVPDVALLRTAASRPALSLAAERDLDPGTPLVQVGHPGGVGYWVISLGLHVERSGADGGSGGQGPPGGPVSPTLKTSIPGRTGNSGSPILALDGTVVGMTNASETRGQGESTGIEVAEPTVYDWPVAPRAWTIGVPADVVRETYEGWL